ncbi:hypothetical protein ACOMHN_017685 [Nucella lapillus]
METVYPCLAPHPYTDCCCQRKQPRHFSPHAKHPLWPGLFQQRRKKTKEEQMLAPAHGSVHLQLVVDDSRMTRPASRPWTRRLSDHALQIGNHHEMDILGVIWMTSPQTRASWGGAGVVSQMRNQLDQCSGDGSSCGEPRGAGAEPPVDTH